MFFRERTPDATGDRKGRRVDHMLKHALSLFWNYDVREENRAHRIRVPEPEFKPFRFPGREAVAVRAIAPANVAREPSTLAELGVPGPLASELEATFRMMGVTRGDRVVGYTFTAPDGTRHALRLATAPERDTSGLAA